MKTTTAAGGLHKTKRQSVLILLDMLGSLTVNVYRTFGGRNLIRGITEKIYTSATVHKNMATYKPSVLHIPLSNEKCGVVCMLKNLVQIQLRRAITLGLVTPYSSHNEIK